MPLFALLEVYRSLNQDKICSLGTSQFKASNKNDNSIKLL